MVQSPQMSMKTLRILLVEDSEDDALLLILNLQQQGYQPIHERVASASSLKQALEKQDWDVIICDYVLPGFSGLEALRILQDFKPNIPCIVVSGRITDEIAVAAMRAGAKDFINKDNLSRLGPAIERELAETKVRQDRQAAEEIKRFNQSKYQILSDTAGLLLSSATPETIIQTICEKVMHFLDCDVFFNYLVDAEKNNLHLNAYSGISPESAQNIKWLDLGEAVCGCAAKEACPPILEDIQNHPQDKRISMIKALGIQAYACHPISSAGGVIGTLSFGSHRKVHFNNEELELMRSITSQVALALNRRRYEDQLEAYAKRITQVQEEERKRIARELHDDTAQAMAILSLELDSIISNEKMCSAKSLERLKSVKATTDRTMQDIRRYSHELHSSLLDHLGLVAALEQLVDETNYRDSLKTDLEVEGQERKLAEDIELALFRIAQQALRNTWQHAQATQARVTLEYLPDKVKLTIVDNGKGFNPDIEREAAIKRGSLGLISMKERARLIGADLKIESKPDKGTAVSVELKL